MSTAPTRPTQIECSAQERSKGVPGSISTFRLGCGEDFQTELESHPLHYKFATPVSATPIHSCLSPPTTSCVLCLALRLLPLLLPILPFPPTLCLFASASVSFLVDYTVATDKRVAPCCAIFYFFHPLSTLFHDTAGAELAK